MIKHLCLSALAVIVLMNASLASSQTSAHRLLENVKALDCRFFVYVSGTWAAGQPHAEVHASTLSLRFDSVDIQDGTAHLVDASGPPFAVVRLTEGSLHLLMIDNDGPLYVTTVFARETRGGKLFAVHTRHAFTEVSLPGFVSRPEQYYGECEIVPSHEGRRQR